MPGDFRAITDSDPGVDVPSDVPDEKAEQGGLTDASTKRAGVGKSLCTELDGTHTCKQQVRILAELGLELRDLRVPLGQPSLLRRQTGNG